MVTYALKHFRIKILLPIHASLACYSSSNMNLSLTNITNITKLNNNDVYYYCITFFINLIILKIKSY